jgi:hypothetical protein
MRLPSVRTIARTFPDLTPEEATRIRRIIEVTETRRDADAREWICDNDPSGAASSYVNQCYHYPPAYLVALYAIDGILRTCGVEGFRCEGPEDGGYTNARARRFRGKSVSYCNTGDSYAPTVAYVGGRNDGAWYVAHYVYFLGD